MWCLLIHHHSPLIPLEFFLFLNSLQPFSPPIFSLIIISLVDLTILLLSLELDCILSLCTTSWYYELQFVFSYRISSSLFLFFLFFAGRQGSSWSSSNLIFYSDQYSQTPFIHIFLLNPPHLSFPPLFASTLFPLNPPMRSTNIRYELLMMRRGGEERTPQCLHSNCLLVIHRHNRQFIAMTEAEEETKGDNQQRDGSTDGIRMRKFKYTHKSTCWCKTFISFFPSIDTFYRHSS